MARPPKVLAIILAGGVGGRLSPLTDNRAKPVVPFGGVYRLIDFALSNCMHSGLPDVWVVEQYLPHSINDHLANGRPWDMDRTYGGLKVIPPFKGNGDKEGFAEGNADALYRQIDFIRDFAPDLVLVLSADHVYKLDYRELIDFHLERKAAVTMAVKEMPEEDVRRYGVVKTDTNGRVTDFDYKSENPISHNVTIEVFLYDAQALIDALEHLAKEGLEDFGHQLVPYLVKQGNVHAFPFTGYWRDVGTRESYWQGHQDLLDEPEELALADRAWPIVSLAAQSLPARVAPEAVVDCSLLSPGCNVKGKVRRSVLGPNVEVDEGAVVEDSVVLEHARIKPGAVVRRALVDAGIHVEAGQRLEGGDEIAVSEAGARPAMRGAGHTLSGPA